MKYHNITNDDLLNGDGLRTILWVSGCNHYCPGCQNPVTWNPDDGIEFDAQAEQELWSYIDKDYCSGLTLSGGDPMFPRNRSRIHKLCRDFRKRYGDSKTIWMYTGYRLEEIKHEPVLKLIDVIVDGEFVQALADVNYHWGGSTNQRVWYRRPWGWEQDFNLTEGESNEVRRKCNADG